MADLGLRPAANPSSQPEPAPAPRPSAAAPVPAPAPQRCLSVVMPCYNEEPTIARVIDRVLASPFTGELLVVDDGSRDRSVEIVRGIRDERVRLFVQPRNMGKGAALRRGLALARFPYVIVQDADLEYDPAEYEIVLRPLLDDKADVVFGSRFHTSRPHRVLYYWHSVGNRVLTTASNMGSSLNLTDMETCYKAFRREVIQSLVIEEDRFGFEPEVTAKVGAARHRVYEVGISYDGRTYDEGKKIGWRDGVRALYCIGRYSWQARREPRARELAPAAAADEELRTTLESLDDGHNYADWIVELLAPHLRGTILEVGAGHGTFTERLAAFGRVVATELSADCLDKLRQRFADRPDVEVVAGDLASVVPGRRFDAAVLINVLEHIADDVGALGRLRDALAPGGRVLVFVPAFDGLYSRFDAAVGHHRRYGRAELMTRAYQAGLEVEDIRFVNSLGALAWWALATKLGRTPTTRWPVRLYDSFVVPLLRRMEASWEAPFGQSLLMVARRPDQT